MVRHEAPNDRSMLIERSRAERRAQQPDAPRSVQVEIDFCLDAAEADDEKWRALLVGISNVYANLALRVVLLLSHRLIG